jgi:cell wall-associated NlpC family hydrolase
MIKKNVYGLVTMIFTVITVFYIANVPAVEMIRLFPIEKYDKSIEYWINSGSKKYEKKLLDTKYQKQRLFELIGIYYSALYSNHRHHSNYPSFINYYRSFYIGSPWNKAHVEFVLNNPNKNGYFILDEENLSLSKFDNSLNIDSIDGVDKRIYGINFRPYDEKWLNKIRDNMNLSNLAPHYNPQNRAIATGNIAIRALPTYDRGFYNHKIAGEGYPFDNLQLAAVNPGTPLYILTTSRDRRWYLVLAPEYLGWVESLCVARVDAKFIKKWRYMANQKTIGFIRSDVSVLNQYGHYQFSGYVGMFLPAATHYSSSDARIRVLIPIKMPDDTAKIGSAKLNSQDVVVLPLVATPKNFAKVLSSLHNRPYAWGGMDSYNDCSAEMKAIFALFGIFLPRNSTFQLLAGKTVNLDNESPEMRLKYLSEHGVAFLTIVYIKGHVLLYLGNHKII